MFKNFKCFYFFLPLLFLAFASFPAAIAHHYKGLPHNSYFENYPQVPSLEYFVETEKWEVVVTIFNFDGIDLENVQDNNIIRFYVFLYDLTSDSVYKRPATFEIYQNNSLLAQKKDVQPEQENIYLIRQEILEQSDLKLRVYFEEENEGRILEERDFVDLPFQIKKSLWEKASVPVYIVLFFVLIAIIKMFIKKKEENVQVH